ncbi:MAG: hypothetical protein JNN20_14570 [Betaproteobacteria bacterium]|nr:hypothetical protein [Betaproteobacteria bacterium]
MQSLSLAALDVPSRTQQHFLLDADTGVLCRVLGLYAARGIAIDHLDYHPAGVDGMRLCVTAGADSETMRILIAKAGSLFGVIDAAL